MKLYELPQGSKLGLQLTQVDAQGDEQATQFKLCTFHHIDGNYSVVTIDDEPAPRNVIHINASANMVKSVFGDYYVFDGQDPGERDAPDNSKERA